MNELQNAIHFVAEWEDSDISEDYSQLDKVLEAARLVASIDDEWTAELIYDESVAWNMECRGETESSWPEYAELTEFAKTPWRSMAVAARLAITGGPLAAAFTPPGATG